MKSRFDDYIQLYNADLTRLCISLCGDKSEAEDLLQDTWLKALKNYKKYDVTKPFDKWLFSICVNTYKNKINSAFFSKRKCFQNEEEERLFFSSIEDITPDNREDYLELHKAIRSLSKKHRTVIVLYYFKDYSIKDISQILNISAGTVKSRLSTARSHIKRRFTNE